MAEIHSTEAARAVRIDSSSAARRPGDDTIAARNASRTTETQRPDRTDRLELSEQARALLAAQPPSDTDPGVRTGLIRAVRTLIDSGFYDTSERIDDTVEQLLNRLGEPAQAANNQGDDANQDNNQS